MHYVLCKGLKMKKNILFLLLVIMTACSPIKVIKLYQEKLPSVATESVQFVTEHPGDVSEIADINLTYKSGIDGDGALEEAFEKLRGKAAKMGANGVYIKNKKQFYRKIYYDAQGRVKKRFYSVEALFYKI